jgi:hypothetical protein
MIQVHEVDPSVPRGVVYGRVYCATPQFPLAAARIVLEPIADGWGNWPQDIHCGVSDSNGLFELPRVLKGNYHAFAVLPGYVSAASLLPRRDVTGVPESFEDSCDVLDRFLPRVTVDPDKPAVIDFRLEKGGSISGDVFWRDGSCASDIETALMLISSEGRRQTYSATGRRSTNSDGSFLLGGLPAGKYIVGARVPRFLPYVRSYTDSLRGLTQINCFSSFYWTGETANPRDARPIQVETGLDAPGIKITLPMCWQEPLARIFT